jgi:dihydrodipicolinate synthase/N-acetylneuraminate lyase
MLGTIAEHWYRYRMRGALPIGVVSGPANALPREWARAWQVCRAGDIERMAEMQGIVESFRSATEVAAGGRRTIACLKRALLRDGVISSAAVASGTPALGAPDADRFDARYEAVLEKVRAQLGEPWATR